MIKFKDYKQLDGTVKTQVASAGDCLRRFDKTPFPVAETDVVCPHFMLLAWANGCPYNCAYCYLKGTFRFYGQKPNGRVPIVFKDRDRLRKEFVTFLNVKDLPAEIINTGELSDSLMDEAQEPSKGSMPFSEFIMQYFKDTQHKVLFLTKSANIANFLKNEWQKNVILSWSINADGVAKTWELYAPNVYERLYAAQQVYKQGYEVRLRIDPMVPVENWKLHYADLVEKIFEMLTPSRVTLGCLRGLTTTIIYCKDKSWTKYLAEKSNWGKKPPFNQRLEMYHFVIDLLKQKGLKNFGVCKDTLGMWKALRLDPTQIKCNCVW
jgi:spore photoproduct lyase